MMFRCACCLMGDIYVGGQPFLVSLFHYPYNIGFFYILHLQLRSLILLQSSNISIIIISNITSTNLLTTFITSPTLITHLIPNILSTNMSTYNNDMTTSPSSHFDSYVDVEDLTSYARIMHEHTRKQMEAASRSARRRSGHKEVTGTISSQHSISSSTSSRGSVSSAGSR